MSVGVVTVVDLTPYMTYAVFDSDENSLIENDVIEIGRLTAAASDNLKASMDTERVTASTSLVAMKRVVVPKRYAKGSTFRIKFDIKSNHDAVTVTGQIFKNGSAHGTSQTRLGQVYDTKTEDLSFDGGDLLEVKICVPSNNGYIQNLRVYCDTGGDALIDGDLAW